MVYIGEEEAGFSLGGSRTSPLAVSVTQSGADRVSVTVNDTNAQTQTLSVRADTCLSYRHPCFPAPPLAFYGNPN